MKNNLSIKPKFFFFLKQKILYFESNYKMETELMKINHIKYLEKKIVTSQKKVNDLEDILDRFKHKYNGIVCFTQ